MWSSSTICHDTKFSEDWSLISSLVKKYNHVLCIFNARFGKQRGCRTRKFAKIHITYHVLEHMNTFHIQMAEVAVPKLKRTTIYWRLHQVGHIRSIHLRTNCLCVAQLQWLEHQNFTKHLYELNCTFKTFDTSLLTKSKLAYNQGM